MLVYIHRDQEEIRQLLLPFVNIRYIEDGINLRKTSVLLIRASDPLAKSYPAGLVTLYDEDITKIRSYAVQKLREEYQYRYLRYHLTSNDTAQAIAIGSSYMLFGLDMSLVPDWCNLALASQDIYYGVLLAKEFYKRCKYKQVFWGGYYYSLFSDLSMVKDQGELKAHVSDTYSRLFLNKLGLHNATLVPVRRDEVLLSAVYDVPKIVDDTIAEFFSSCKGMFWNNHRKRFDWKTTLWGDKSKAWNEVAINQKEICGKYRAEQHNKSINHHGAYEENVSILKEFGEWCRENRIKLHIINFPVTDQYRNCLDPRFKKTYYKTLREFAFPFEFYDYDEAAELFNDDDFNDTDHLNDRGAYKLTASLKEIVE